MSLNRSISSISNNGSINGSNSHSVGDIYNIEQRLTNIEGRLAIIENGNSFSSSMYTSLPNYQNSQNSQNNQNNATTTTQGMDIFPAYNGELDQSAPTIIRQRRPAQGPPTPGGKKRKTKKQRKSTKKVTKTKRNRK